ncbi:MAG: hypothetical protein DME26_07290 [Verrucomicrobia bacterium]|nr:MAG: hypothetical protein DME26_07290 [Verrucomicrobiota bacterium]
MKQQPELKMKMNPMHSLTRTMLAIASLLWLAAARAEAADAKTNRATTARVIVNKDADPEKEVVIKVVTDEDEDARPAKDRTWLGVGVEEASEALMDQLGLDAGVGLVVTQVSADSPAAKAGLKKNDLLVELAGQSLVHPAQLRKLVQARKPGDEVKLVLYRGGKKHTESATLEQAPARLGLLDEGSGEEKVRQLHRELLKLPHGEALQAHAKALQESLSHVSGEVRRDPARHGAGAQGHSRSRPRSGSQQGFAPGRNRPAQGTAEVRHQRGRQRHGGGAQQREFITEYCEDG